MLPKQKYNSFVIEGTDILGYTVTFAFLLKVRCEDYDSHVIKKLEAGGKRHVTLRILFVSFVQNKNTVEVYNLEFFVGDRLPGAVTPQNI